MQNQRIKDKYETNPFHPMSNDWAETTFQKNSYWGKIHLGVLDNPKNTISNGNAILVKEMI